jgi:hypothetical protein
MDQDGYQNISFMYAPYEANNQRTSSNLVTVKASNHKCHRNSTVDKRIKRKSASKGPKILTN